MCNARRVTAYETGKQPKNNTLIRNTALGVMA